ncbi:MAG TPA: MBG domain-containing protein, partial [Candidatus Saccharimonadales bacterium]|nr:MBG domain-containing protein [Candidatus Saccharimonadales bacterium]
TPTLLGLWATGPYLHDGSASTLEQAIAAHSGVVLDGTDLNKLAEFLRELDDLGTNAILATVAWPNPAAITYGTALGIQLNATANVPGTFVYTPNVGTVLKAGNGQALSVTFTPDDLATYSVTTASVLIDVQKAPLTITAENKSKVYGAALPLLTAIYSGFVNGDTTANLDSGVSLSSSATAASSVGNYPISLTAGPDNEYTITLVNGVLAVTPAPLVIAAQNKSKVYGSANPALTANYTGFVNGDNVASLDRPVVLASSATAVSGVGNYSISASGATDLNYSISFANGTLSVTPAALTIRADDKTRTAGQPNPVFTATYTGFVNGDTANVLSPGPTFTTSATQASPAGNYPIVASGAAAVNYLITHVNGTLTITPAFAVKINFQPSGSPIPAGYLADFGSAFANRGNGYSYGWSGNNSGQTKDRNSTLSLDQRYDTLISMQKTGSGRTWEIAVPNGSYAVFLVAGDATAFDSVYQILVENVLTLSGTPTSANRWISGTKTVVVSDGRLTISNGPAAKNNKLCFIDIVTTPTIAASPLFTSQQPAQLTWIGRTPDGRVKLAVQGAALYTDCLVEASSDFITWERLTTLPNVDGTLTFPDPKDGDVQQRFYRVLLSP